MGTDDKLSNKAQEWAGKAKEGIGNATGDDDLVAEGRADQVKAEVKRVVQVVKDAAGDVADGVKDAAKNATKD